MINVGYKIHDHAIDLPKIDYQTIGAAGLDLYAANSEKISLSTLERYAIPTGISLAIPSGYEGQIRPRSGLAAKSNISVLNTPGTIDSDYRGEIKVILFNHGNKNFKINNNDRIAQMILTPVIKMDLEETNELPDSIRGAGGFGSTGK